MIICFKEKWNDRFVEGPDAETICAKILRERIKDEWFYDSVEQIQAEEALKHDNAFYFMQRRRSYEYEEFYEIAVEKAEASI